MDQYDVAKYFFEGKFKTDLIYEGINTNFVMLFLANNKSYKSKKTGKVVLKTWDEMRKYRDAIQWGAMIGRQLLPITFYTEFESFLSGYKKEYANAAAEGRVDESSADPISFHLYPLLLR